MKRLLLFLLIALSSLGQAFAQTNKVPDLAIYTDSLLVQHFLGGYIENEILHLFSKGRFIALQKEEKAKLLSIFQPYYTSGAILIDEGDTIEYWTKGKDGKPQFFDSWTAGSLSISEYLPVSINHYDQKRFFWYAGGQINGSKGYFSANLSGRAGAFLYKDKIDASLSLNAGGHKSQGNFSFSAEIGVLGRYFFDIKGLPLRPYAGLGTTLLLSEPVSLEAVLYSGISYKLGPGSLDLGLQYGTISSIRGTIGYTFYPKVLNGGEKR